MCSIGFGNLGLGERTNGMLGFRGKFRVSVLVVFTLWISFAAFYTLLKPVPNDCVMTYMYPTYIPIPTPANVSSDKYELFLYHEGWKQIDFQEHLMKLSGVPVLFIPGNGGSYKQVRSLAAESARAYQAGPLERNFYQEASFLTNIEQGSAGFESEKSNFPSQYSKMLDWFTVDLEGEHSAMDGWILEEHAEYVVYAIHRILDLYKESRVAHNKAGIEISAILPQNVILVGHSMGGFVARAAVVHPQLRKLAVETVLTLSSPHQSPPVAVQPSLGHYFSDVNDKWRYGYKVQTSRSGQQMSSSTLSHIVVISISGGTRDYQVRSNLASLDQIVPPSHGFMLCSTNMKNVWITMEHQSILWCNQLVVQVSHALLSIIDSTIGQPFSSVQRRMSVFSKMFHTGIPQHFDLLGNDRKESLLAKTFSVKSKLTDAGSQVREDTACLKSFEWNDNVLERDLYIQTSTVSILAMDGKRRWLDIHNLGGSGKMHFIFVTNLIPCSGVRLHLWPEKDRIPSGKEASAYRNVLEVTSRMVSIPAGPAPRQIEPGSQTEQAPPSAVLLLRPDEMHGFRFLTISVAPSPTVSGRPPPAVSMGVGQFFNLEESYREVSAKSLLLSSYIQEEFFLKEEHPLVLNLSFAITLGLLPATLSIKTVGCGIKDSGLPVEQSGDIEHSSICKLRCFPPVAVIWDSSSTLQIVPNLYSETLVVDSSPPALWSYVPSSDRSTMLLMVDPHCAYKIGVSVSITASASRFLLLYSSKIIGFSIATVVFALMRQTHAWEINLPVPSALTAVESNLRLPLAFFSLAVLPLIFSLIFSFISGHQVPSFASFLIVTTMCYAFANGCMIILIFFSQLGFYFLATVHIFLKIRWHRWEQSIPFTSRTQFLNFFSSLKVVQISKNNPTLIVALVTVSLVCFVHPALGLILLLLSHISYCYAALCRFLAASFRSHTQKESYNSKALMNASWWSKLNLDDTVDPSLPPDDNSSPICVKDFCETQLETFNYRFNVLILHFIATLMFIPSFVSWLQRIGFGQSFPWFLDSILCVGVILHGLWGSDPEIISFSLSIPGFRPKEFGRSLLYLIAGYYCYFCALDMAPYRAFYALAFLGIISFTPRILQRMNLVGRSDSHVGGRKHSHKHKI